MTTASNPTPLISVIMPAYNAADFIATAIGSIRRQSFENWELIVVDDGSADSTLAEARRAASADSRIFIDSIGHGGQSAARNRGLDLARGEFVAFCDADDTYSPRALATLFGGTSLSEIVVGQYVEGTADPFPMDSHTSESTAEFAVMPAEEALIDTLYQEPRAHNSMSAKLFRRDLFEKIRFIDDMYYEDLEITFRLYRAARSVAFTDEALYFYRTNPSSFINTWHPERLDVLKVTELFEKRAAAIGPRISAAARSRRFSANYNMFLLASQSESDATTADRCWATIRQLRGRILSDPRVRLKNKLGALLSFLGRTATLLAARLTYHKN